MVVDLLPPDEADAVFHALADSTRRDLLRRALHAEASVSSLARHYAISLTAVQKHVVVLERAGLVTKHRRGREQIVRANTTTLHRAAQLLEALEGLWRERVDRMAALLDEEPEPPKKGHRP